jgi:flagellar protein FliS
MQPNGNPASGEYLKNAVMTATAEQLQMMLYDGAIRFVSQARDAMKQRDWETSCERIIRAQKIIMQMQQGLRHEVNPTLCGQLVSLYQFVYSRLVHANITHQVSAMDEALQILEHQRETWRLIVERIKEVDQPPAAKTASAPKGPQRPTEALSLQA